MRCSECDLAALLGNSGVTEAPPSMIVGQSRNRFDI
jgi:hypothetical protein